MYEYDELATKKCENWRAPHAGAYVRCHVQPRCPGSHRLGFIDTQCGFKLMTREAGDAIFGLTRINSFSFDVEMILIAKRQGFGVKDIPVRWIDSRGSRVHPIRDSAHMLLDLLRIKLYDLFGLYRK